MREDVKAARDVFDDIAADVRGRIAQGLKVSDDDKAALFFAQLLDNDDDFSVGFALEVAALAHKRRTRDQKDR